jgi:hypothetical protein
LQGSDERARGREIVDRLVEGARLIHSPHLTTTARWLLTHERNAWWSHRALIPATAARVREIDPREQQHEIPLRIVTGSASSSAGQANVPRSSRL